MFEQLLKAIDLEANYQEYWHNFTEFYWHNPNLPMRRPLGRAAYTAHLAISPVEG